MPETNYGEMDIKALKELATSRGIEFPRNATAAVVVDLLEAQDEAGDQNPAPAAPEDDAAKNDDGTQGAPSDAAVNAAAEENAQGGNPTPNPNVRAGRPAPAKGTHFYWLKRPSYANHTDIWESGLYQTNKPVQRFENAPLEFIEHYEDEIPDMALMEIAKHYRVAVDVYEGNKRKQRPTEEILETIVQVKEI